MSITKTYDVFCDRQATPGCRGWADGASSTTSAAEARRLAKRLGWKRIGGADVCPPCQSTSSLLSRYRKDDHLETAIEDLGAAPSQESGSWP